MKISVLAEFAWGWGLGDVQAMRLECADVTPGTPRCKENPFTNGEGKT